MKRLIFSMMVVSLLLTVGCHRHPAGLPKCYPCSVQILKDGAVVPESTVTLVPVEEEGNNFIGAGTVNSSGLAVVSTHYRGDEVKGLPAGDYKVVVSAPSAISEIKIDRAEMRKMPMEERLKLDAQMRQEREESNPVPMALRSRENSPITVTVSSSGENKFEVEMSDYEDE